MIEFVTVCRTNWIDDVIVYDIYPLYFCPTSPLR